jgi:translation elongation factor EF-Ts
MINDLKKETNKPMNEVKKSVQVFDKKFTKQIKIMKKKKSQKS